MRIELRLIFQKETFNGKKFIDLISHENILGFVPTFISSSSLDLVRKKLDVDSHYELIKSIEYDINLSLESESLMGNSLSIRNPGLGGTLQVFHWVVDEQIFHNIKFDTFLTHPNFICGYAFDYEFVMWQSEESIHNYKYFERDYSNLETKYDKTLMEKLIDVSKNPGRDVLLPGLYLMASWKMWFGNNFYKFVPKEKLLNFEFANLIESNESYTFINLYEDLSKSESEQNLVLLQKFRDWCEFDVIEQNLLGLSPKSKKTSNWFTKLFSKN